MLEIARVQDVLVKSLHGRQRSEDDAMGTSWPRGRWRWEKQGELQLFLPHPRPHKQDVLVHKRKVFALSLLFPEFPEEGRSVGDGDGAVETLTWALPLAGAGQRWGLHSFPLPRAPLSCLTPCRVSCTWVNPPFSQDTT